MRLAIPVALEGRHYLAAVVRRARVPIDSVLVQVHHAPASYKPGPSGRHSTPSSRTSLYECPTSGGNHMPMTPGPSEMTGSYTAAIYAFNMPSWALRAVSTIRHGNKLRP